MNMISNVTDARSNPNDQIDHAVRTIGRSKDRTKVFDAIYRGKQKIKTVGEIAKKTGLNRIRVLQEAKKLASNGIVHQKKIDGETGYEKDNFYAAQKAKIQSFVKNPLKLKSFPTKTRPQPLGSRMETFHAPARLMKISQITIDDIDSFAKVKKIAFENIAEIPMGETKFKNGVMKILGERGIFKDWGGEKNDLCTTRLRYQGKRRSTAFAFKGKGKTGKLTPAKMGKNGDQIQRLFQSPAEVFLLQYWSQIDDSVLEQMQNCAKVKSLADGRTVFYGIIDGQDSSRLIQAYPKKFRV